MASRSIERKLYITVMSVAACSVILCFGVTYWSVSTGLARYVGPELVGVFLQRVATDYLLVTLLVLGPAAILTRHLSRDLLNPIKSVVEGARSVSQGSYDVQISEMNRKDELGELARSFDLMARTLRAAEQSRQDWVADTSHELRTPLAVLRAEVEALQDGVHEANEKTLGVLHQEVMNLTHLVGDLNQLAQADAGGLAYRFSRTDLGALVAATAESFRERLSRVDLALKIKVTGSCHIDGDADRLRQLWGNLLENSLRYTDSGGTIEIQVGKTPETVTALIKDSKPTVPEELQSRLFQRFFRADPSRTRGRGGSGLGLALVQKIVEAHGGTIVARTSDLGGLEIAITFPRAVE